MATFENAGLALQPVNNIHGLVRDMQDTANAGINAGGDYILATALDFERTF